MIVLCTGRKLCSLLLSKNNILNGNILLDRFLLRAQSSGTRAVKSKPSLLLLTVIGAGAGVAVGGGYSLYVTQKARLPISYRDTGSAGHLINTHPDVIISRRVSLTYQEKKIVPNVLFST